METVVKKRLKFATSEREFSSVLNKRVNSYFKENRISKHANFEMVLKTVIMFTVYLIPYGLIVSGVVTEVSWALLMILIMGIGGAGIGLSVMHDANHGSYTNHPMLNRIIGRSLEVLGGSSFTWKVQHNVLHHTYTNIYEEDEDISPRGILRFTPHTPWKPMHRYQHVYAWFFYGFMTFVWVFIKDYNRLFRYHKMGLVKKQKADITNEWIVLIASKILYLGYMFVIPLIFTDFAWWQILLGIFLLHYVFGFILAIIFQPAHVIEGTEFPVPDEDLRLENSWAVHQLHTTSNYANKSRLLSWYVGGLNFQIEHHLFPGVCHVHYRKISEIVKKTAEEFKLPYKSFDRFVDALNGHQRILKELGKKPAQG